MIKLDEKDIKVVASNRYYRRKRWWVVGGLIPILLIGMALLYFLPKSPVSWLSIAPLLFYVILVTIISIRESRFTKKFIETWKKEGVS